MQQTHPEQYQTALNQNRALLRNLQGQLRTLELTEEAPEILDNFNPQDLSRILKQSANTINKPVTLIRQTQQRIIAHPNPQPPVQDNQNIAQKIANNWQKM